MIKLNEKYGKLTVISILPSLKTVNLKTGKQSSLKQYLTNCDCGKQRKVSTRYLLKTVDPCCCSCAFGRRPQSLKRQDPYIRTYKVLKNSAKKRGKICTLLFEDFKKLTTGKCYYCDTEPQILKWGREPEILYNGIDRVDNNIGYELGNCVSCCAFCNTAKLTNTKEEFFSFVEKIYNKWLTNKGTDDRNKVYKGKV